MYICMYIYIYIYILFSLFLLLGKVFTLRMRCKQNPKFFLSFLKSSFR